MRQWYIILLILLASGCSRHSKLDVIVKKSPYADTLIDKVNGLQFYLDTQRITIYAFNQNGKLLWKSDPWKDNKLQAYRVKRPIIRYFEFENNKFTKFNEKIGIGYNNSQFGNIDKFTGEFVFRGQD